LPTLSLGFAAFERGDFFAAVEVLAPLAAENAPCSSRSLSPSAD
jgi:hypothetical protein